MRTFHYLTLFAAAVTIATAQEEHLRFIIDSPGPEYRQMRGDLIDKSLIAPSPAPEAILTFQPRDVATAKLLPADNDMSQIQLIFRPESIQQIKEYIEFNKAKPIRIEIGDYTLPLDIKKTLPWTTGVWLEGRPNEKAKTILESLKKQK